MILVALSIAVLFAAPVIALALARSASLAQLLDSFVLVAVAGIVAVHIVPQSASIAGPAALAAVVVGVFLPILLHRIDAALLHGPATSTNQPPRNQVASAARHGALLAVFALGIFVHGMFDGTALGGAVATPALAVAVLLHRLPVGIALWTVVRPKLGLARLGVIVGAYAGGTVTGALVGGAVLTGASAPLLALVQAFVAGSILHIVAESPPYAPSSSSSPSILSSSSLSSLTLSRARPVRVARAPLVERMRRPFVRVAVDGVVVSAGARVAGVVGAALAVLVLFGVEHLDGEHAAAIGLGAGLAAGDAFFALAVRTAPAALLSFVLVGVLTALYPDGVPGIAGRGSRVIDAALGAAAGLPHPLCSCAVAPLYQSLVERGATPAGARAFLVAAPELGVPALLVGARLLGLPFTLARILGAAALAVLAGVSAPGAHATVTSSRTGSFAARLSRGMRHGLKDAVDHVGPWLVLGLAVAALLEAALNELALAGVPQQLLTVALAVAALPLYLCAAGATPVAAVLVHKGASAGAVLAFLLVGPATSLPTLSLVKRLHGARAAAAFAVLVTGGAVVVGLVTDVAIAHGVLSAPLDALGALHANADGVASVDVVDVGALIVVAALLLASLVRQGVRGFLVQIMSPQHAHAGDHGHGPGCGHDHGPPVAAPVGVPRVALSFDPRGSQ